MIDLVQKGPFGGEEMRQWLEAGYFKGNLPISQDPSGQFRPLASLFPDLSVAFKPTGPSKEELAALAEAEDAKRRAAEEAAAAKARAERERIEKERAMRAKAEERAAEALKQQQDQEPHSKQNQSAQLKKLLGLGGIASSSAVEGIQKGSMTEQTKQTSANKTESQSKMATSKETNKTNGEAAAEPVQPVPVQPAAPAWGGAGTNKPAVQRKTMSEIQQEEARVAARAAKQKPQNTSGWANIAASGGASAWSGNTAVVSSVPVAAASATLPQTVNHSVPRTKTPITGVSVAKQPKSQTSTQKTMEEFGANGKMTPALETWCKEQMRKLSGSDDLTLIAFCMTLSDPVEIKGYLTAYLGSTPQVNSFASEFVNRKNGTKQQEQWETTGGSKKGRKKKGAVAK